ncbi:DUF1275 family protein [Planotetraspora sp. GP83]|uniref:DUF1275 family protein n=1 Tax=Planotetraspora sp. GP83 TaxID=3156264 RepID=UPI0035115E94
MPAGAVSRTWRARLGPLVLATALTAATGATNAISFIGLGGVFTSVMTGNLVLLGLSAGRPDAALAANAAGAIAGFAAGVLAGGRIVGPSARGHPGWTVRVAAVLGCELVLFGLFLGTWAAAGGRPAGAERLVLAVVAAFAMGVQSAAVRTFGIPGLSTTFFTGTLTGVLAGLVTGGRVFWDSVVLLAALVAGAAGGGWLVLHALPAAPALPMALLAFTLAALRPLAVWPDRSH